MNIQLLFVTYVKVPFEDHSHSDFLQDLDFVIYFLYMICELPLHHWISEKENLFNMCIPIYNKKTVFKKLVCTVFIKHNTIVLLFHSNCHTSWACSLINDTSVHKDYKTSGEDPIDNCGQFIYCTLVTKCIHSLYELWKTEAYTIIWKLLYQHSSLVLQSIESYTPHKTRTGFCLVSGGVGWGTL